MFTKAKQIKKKNRKKNELVEKIVEALLVNF